MWAFSEHCSVCSRVLIYGSTSGVSLGMDYLFNQCKTGVVFEKSVWKLNIFAVPFVATSDAKWQTCLLNKFTQFRPVYVTLLVCSKFIEITDCYQYRIRFVLLVTSATESSAFVLLKSILKSLLKAFNVTENQMSKKSSFPQTILLCFMLFLFFSLLYMDLRVVLTCANCC